MAANALSAGSRSNQSDVEMEYARLRAEHVFQRDAAIAKEKAVSPAWQGKKDEVNISEAARKIFDGYGGASEPLGNEAPHAGMSAVTRHGSRLQLEAHAVSSGKFSMARFGEREADSGVGFKMSGANSGDASELMYTLTVTRKNGEMQTHVLTGNTHLTEDDDGNIRVKDTDARNGLIGTDGQDILINLTEGGTVRGNGGDDIIFNLAENANLGGGEGNDVIISLGNGTSISGGNGDDAVAVLYDTLHPYKEDRRINEKGESEVVGRPKNSQQINIDGGDGNDTIVAQANLYRSRISGGAGMDTIEANDLLESVIDGGDGSDTITVRDLVNSTLLGGDGSDLINITGKVESSIIQGGGGDDAIKITGGRIRNSMINGGSGNDLLEIYGGGGDKGGLHGSKVIGGDGDDILHFKGETSHSEIDAGAGNDFAWMQGKVSSSKLYGGEGNDTLAVDEMYDSLLDGGDGDDDITVVKARNSVINGGKGADSITVNEAVDSTIAGGADGVDADGRTVADRISVEANWNNKTYQDMADADALRPAKSLGIV